MGDEARKARKSEKERAKERAKELRKDRLIQTRVDRRLQHVLQEEARRRRMSISNLVRGVLEDAFGVADPDVGPVLDEPVAPATTEVDLSHVYAWNAVTLGKDAACGRCRAPMQSGDSALIGLSEDATAARAWLCRECGDEL